MYMDGLGLGLGLGHALIVFKEIFCSLEGGVKFHESVSVTVKSPGSE